MTASSLDFFLHGVRLRLESSHSSFLQAARQTLADLLVMDSGRMTARTGLAQIETRLHWNSSPPEEWQGRGGIQWGRRLLQRGQRVLQSEVLSLPGLQIEASWQNERLCVDAYYRRPPVLRGGLQRFLGDARLYAALSYYLVYFPLLHYLEQTRSLHPLHAAAVEHPQGSFLLAGLPGGGKSTLSMAFLEDPRARLLSDNLVLYNSEQVYSCPEIIHLSSDSLSWLPASALRRLEPTGHKHSYGRGSYHLVKEARASSTRPQALFFLGLADQTILHPVPTPLAASRLSSLDGMAKEIIAYHQFAAAVELAAPMGSQHTRRHTTLHSLLQKMVCFELRLEAGGDLRLARNLVNDVLAAQVGGGE